jgi:hypothetical protein
MRRGARLAAIGAVTCLSMVGVLLVAKVTGATQATPVVVEKRQTAFERLNGRGVVLRPPPPGGPRVSAKVAWAAVDKVHQAPSPPGRVVARLATVTTEGTGKANADGTVTPMYKDRLVWVVEIPTTVLMPDIGPMEESGQPRSTPAPRLCPAFFFVDAATGAALFAAQDCIR